MKKVILLSTLCCSVLFSVQANADTSGLVKLSSDSSGQVEIPFYGTEQAYWVLLNDCALVMSGQSKPGEKIKYRPLGYGDIFYLQRFYGGVPEFSEVLTYLRLIDSTHGCGDKARFKAARSTYVTPQEIARQLKNVYAHLKIIDSGTGFDQALASLPKVSGKSCPNSLPSTAAEEKQLEDCLDASAIGLAVDRLADKLERYPTPALVQGGLSDRYSVRKQFSTFTIKSSFAVAPAEHTALTTAYVSVYPTAEFISSESFAWLDRISLDLGVAKQTGDTANEEFKSAGDHYMFGFGFDMTENFSIHIADILAFSEGKTKNDFAVGISFDVLSLFSKLNK